ncbi:hypothetical protein EI555_021409, partial [Monodon monoceros]
MASDDFDIVIEAMLEAPYKKEEDEQQTNEVEKESPSNTTNSTSCTGSSGSGTSGSSASWEAGSRSRDRHRRRSSRSRSRDRQRRHRSRSWERRHGSESRSRDRRREDRVRYRSPPLATGYHLLLIRSPLYRVLGRRYGHSKSPHFREKSPVREPVDNLSPEERDARTVFCMQLAARIRPRDLEDFFSAVGKVRDVRIISDRNSRRSKGIAYVEFCEIQSVPLAIGLTGQRLLGVPIIVQASQAEKNRLAAMANNLQKGSGGPMRLYVGSLHFNITEDMLRGIFEPFGKIDNIVLMKDSDTGRSKGYGFITFSDSECARRALEQLNGFELAGRPMRVGHVTERLDGGTDITFPDGDQDLDLGSACGRLQLMAKLAEGLNPTSSFPLRLWNPAADHRCCRPSCCLATEWSSSFGGPEPSGFDCSESGPEPRLPGNRLPVLPAFQPLYPPNHVSLKAQLISVFTVTFFPPASRLHLLHAT